MNQEINKIAQATNNILGVKTQLKKKKVQKKQQTSQNKKAFEGIIKDLEFVVERERILEITSGIDLAKYNDGFFVIIDKLLQIKYGKEVSELVYFYLYERINPDSTLNVLKDPQGNEVVIKNFNDLWNIVEKFNPPTTKKK